MKSIAMGVILSSFVFLNLARADEGGTHFDQFVHEDFQWSDGAMAAGENTLEECYACVFPLDWLENQGDEVLESMVIEEEELLVHQVKYGKSSASRSSGRMTYPVRGGARFLSGLGDRRSGGRRHQGVDLGASRGTTVVSVWPGRVVNIGRGGLGGWSAKILHPNGLSTYYAHFLRAPRVRVGQLVSAGQPIGEVGMSGNARGTVPHLHFEVRKGRSVLNPLSYLRR